MVYFDFLYFSESLDMANPDKLATLIQVFQMPDRVMMQLR